MYDKICADLCVPFKRVGQYAGFTEWWLRPIVSLFALKRRFIEGVDDTRIIGKKKLREFCNNLLSTYEAEYSVIDGISKMKEVWSYLYTAFPGCDKSIKNLRKAKSKAEYLGAVNEIFSIKC